VGLAEFVAATLGTSVATRDDFLQALFQRCAQPALPWPYILSL
jgi:hypothetical protein